MKTKEKIIRASLRLFNEQGVAAISTNHIAADLKISPGNLYYHFRHKEEIVQSLFSRLLQKADTVFQETQNRLPQISDLHHLLQQVFGLLWEYRFFFRELPALLQRDASLAERFQQSKKRSFEEMQRILKGLAETGDMHPWKNALELERVVTNMWVLFYFWYAYVETSGIAVTPQSLRGGVRQMGALLMPYLTPLAQAEMTRRLKRTSALPKSEGLEPEVMALIPAT